MRNVEFHGRRGWLASLISVMVALMIMATPASAFGCQPAPCCPNMPGMAAQEACAQSAVGNACSGLLCQAGWAVAVVAKTCGAAQGTVLTFVPHVPAWSRNFILQPQIPPPRCRPFSDLKLPQS